MQNWKDSIYEVFYSKPDYTSETLMVLNGQNIYLTGKGYTVGLYNQMVELSYSEHGLVFLSFNDDTSWVKISVDPADQWYDRSDAWIPYNKESMKIEYWKDILPKHYLYFIERGNYQFYSAPDTSLKITIDLLKLYEKESIIMHPLFQVGEWLYVELETPSTYCIGNDDDDEFYEQFGLCPKRYNVWIKFLTDTGRPLVYYFTRGC